jgi:hypothetical protein
MNAKVNATINLKVEGKKYIVELYDVDVISDDLLKTLTIDKSGPIEFIFSLSETGEFNPELQLRIFTENRKEIFRTAIDNSLSSLNVDKNTDRVEKTTIDFGVITL